MQHKISVRLCNMINLLNCLVKVPALATVLCVAAAPNRLFGGRILLYCACLWVPDCMWFGVV